MQSGAVEEQGSGYLIMNWKTTYNNNREHGRSQSTSITEKDPASQKERRA